MTADKKARISDLESGLDFTPHVTHEEEYVAPPTEDQEVDEENDETHPLVNPTNNVVDSHDEKSIAISNENREYWANVNALAQSLLAFVGGGWNTCLCVLVLLVFFVMIMVAIVAVTVIVVVLTPNTQS
jgi:hypothetical protein